MGFFSKIFGRNNSNNSNDFNGGFKNQQYPQSNMNGYNSSNDGSLHSLNLDKEASLKQLNLRKETIKSLCLEKKELNGLIARVCMVMDFSGSMDRLYATGKVQAVVERLLPVAMQFDDNGVMEAWLFSNDCNRIPDIDLNNYYDYIKNNKLTKRYYMGGTEYAPVIKDVCKKYMEEEPADIPTLVLFITDGDNSDKNETTKVIKKASNYPIFWQFVGIGNSRFSYLEQLDEMGGRYVDNANFFSVNDLDRISDDELYNRLLAEYPEWINKVKNLGMIP